MPSAIVTELIQRVSKLEGKVNVVLGLLAIILGAVVLK